MAVSREEFLQYIRELLVDIIPELEGTHISGETSLKEAGANSVERMEILVDTMEWAQIRVPLVKFSQLENIGQIVDVMAEHQA